MNAKTPRLGYHELTERIIKVFFDVYNEVSHRFLESVYLEAMAIALSADGCQVTKQASVPVWFRKKQVGDFRADLLIDNLVILELKAVRVLEPSHEAQLLNYLRATDIEIGLLLNFGPKPEFKRMIFDNPRKKGHGGTPIHADQGIATG